jgi:hypothetical protein
LGNGERLGPRLIPRLTQAVGVAYRAEGSVSCDIYNRDLAEMLGPHDLALQPYSGVAQVSGSSNLAISKAPCEPQTGSGQGESVAATSWWGTIVLTFPPISWPPSAGQAVSFPATSCDSQRPVVPRPFSNRSLVVRCCRVSIKPSQTLRRKSVLPGRPRRLALPLSTDHRAMQLSYK